jgi:SHS2 domain-containing protein
LGIQDKGHRSSNHQKFEFFDVTADVGYMAYGNTLHESFENAALAMFEVVTDSSRIKPKITKDISVRSEDEKALLYDWLSELLFIHDTEFLVFSHFDVKIEDKTEKGNRSYLLEAVVTGEEFDPAVHESRDEVKAVTFHMMDIKKEDGYTVRVILDI